MRFAGRGQVIEEAAAPTAAASGTFSTRSLGCRILVTIDRTAPRGVKSTAGSNLGVVAAPLPMHGTTTLSPGLTDPAYCGWVHMSNARRARRFLIVATKTRSIRLSTSPDGPRSPSLPRPRPTDPTQIASIRSADRIRYAPLALPPQLLT